MIVDLSHPIVSGMPVYPGDPEVATAPATSIAVDGFAVTALQLGTHSGTHVDAPSHSIEGGTTAISRPVTPGFNEYQDILTQTFGNIRNGQNVKEALDGTIDPLERALVKYKR